MFKLVLGNFIFEGGVIYETKDYSYNGSPETASCPENPS